MPIHPSVRWRTKPVNAGPVWAKEPQGSKLAALTPEEIQESGDYEILNWIIALGILGDRPAEIVDVRESHTQLAYRVAAV